MRENTIAVVLYQYKIGGCNDWTELLDADSGPTAPPYVIVWSRHADARLWAEVLNLGGYDVLPAPFLGPEVVEAINRAIRKWRERGGASQSDRRALW
jgi:hypothetical protein